MKKIILALVTVISVVSCKDKEDVKPDLSGNYLFFTNLTASKFDQVDVKIDGKTVGLLTKSYTSTVSPSCNTKTSEVVLNVNLPVGSYSLDAVATLNGKKVTSWSDSFRVEEGECGVGRLNSRL